MKPRKPYHRQSVPALVSSDSKVDVDRHGETDINAMMARYNATGVPPTVNRETPLYGDFTDSADLHTQMNRVNEAKEAFASLPSAIRNAADNDPVLFLDMLDDDDGQAVLVQAGLFVDDAVVEETPPPSLPEEEIPPVTEEKAPA